MFLVIPCALVFSACGKKKNDGTGETSGGQTTPEKVVSELSLELAEEHGFDYDAETNTISFVYGDEIEILKETSPAEYELVKQRINTEYVAPLYLTLSFHGTKAVRPFSNEKKLEYKSKLIAIAEKMNFLCQESSIAGPNMLEFAQGV